MNKKVRRTVKEHGPRAIDIHVGKVIRARRRKMKMNQTKLGEVIGVTFQQILKYEKGVNRVSASALWEIAKVLDLKLSDGVYDIGHFFVNCPKFD